MGIAGFWIGDSTTSTINSLGFADVFSARKHKFGSNIDGHWKSPCVEILIIKVWIIMKQDTDAMCSETQVMQGHDCKCSLVLNKNGKGMKLYDYD